MYPKCRFWVFKLLVWSTDSHYICIFGGESVDANQRVSCKLVGETPFEKVEMGQEWITNEMSEFALVGTSSHRPNVHCVRAIFYPPLSTTTYYLELGSRCLLIKE